MDIYASDDEKGEAIKNWWRENGRSVVTGVVLGGAIIFGGRYWINFQQAKTEQAAAMYQQVQMNLSDADLTAAEDLTQELMQTHSATPYAAFASLELAAEQVRNICNGLLTRQSLVLRKIWPDYVWLALWLIRLNTQKLWN